MPKLIQIKRQGFDQDTSFIIKFSGIQKCNILREITDINKKNVQNKFPFGGRKDGRGTLRKRSSERNFF
jgi:hypothetical protein